MTRFMRFCISVILGVIALILIIKVLLVLAYMGFMGWFISTVAFNSKPSTSPPPKAALHQSVKPCPPLSKTPPGTVLRHDCDYSSQGPDLSGYDSETRHGDGYSKPARDSLKKLIEKPVGR